MQLEARMTDTHSPRVTAEGLLKDVKTFFDHGEFFRAYDQAADALELFPGNVGLAHRAVLSLANAGATALALDKYYEFGLDKRPETDARSLLGRLKKDQAFAETGEAQRASIQRAESAQCRRGGHQRERLCHRRRQQPGGRNCRRERSRCLGTTVVERRRGSTRR
jgi:hypothetical protein